MVVKIVAVGKIKERYLEDGIKEYAKRVQPYLSLEIIEVKEVNTSDVAKNIAEEGRRILSVIKPDDFVVALAIEGPMVSSEELAAKVKSHPIYSPKPLVFVVGGSDGLSKEVKERSNELLSFGKLTYPHQLMRLVLVEQLYRACMINHSKKYHK